MPGIIDIIVLYNHEKKSIFYVFLRRTHQTVTTSPISPMKTPASPGTIVSSSQLTPAMIAHQGRWHVPLMFVDYLTSAMGSHWTLDFSRASKRVLITAQPLTDAIGIRLTPQTDFASSHLTVCPPLCVPMQKHVLMARKSVGKAKKKVSFERKSI